MYLLELNNLQLTDYFLFLKKKGSLVAFTNKFRTQVLFVGVFFEFAACTIFSQNGKKPKWLELHDKMDIASHC